MTSSDPDESDAQWLAAQIEEYKQIWQRYNRYAHLLKQTFELAVAKLCPGAIVEARPKSIASFAEKALRKRVQYADPLARFTDLCGARVIAHTRAEVAAVNTWIEENFEISWQDSGDAAERLGPISFGYGSMHYIVAFQPGTTIGVEIPDEVYGLKAEVQVRTMLQHVWATLAHRLSYKSALELPPSWQREFAVLAAQLENAENAVARIEEALPLYASGHRSYSESAEINREISLLETVLRHDRKNAKLASHIARLASSVGDWAKVVGVLDPIVTGDEPLDEPTPLTQLGWALCKLNDHAPDSESFRQGQAYLRRAGQPPDPDSYAISYLADTWQKRDSGKARDLYRRAFELDPTSHHVLARYLEHEISQTNSASFLPLLRPMMTEAIDRCRAEVQMKINSPAALFGMAKLQLLRGDADESMKTYCAAVRASTAPHMINDEIASLERLSGASAELPGFEFVRLLLFLGAAAKFPFPSHLSRLDAYTSQDDTVIAGPVVIVAGGTDSDVEQRLKEYQGLLLGAFDGYQGTIVSGGTTSGISGLVGAVARRYPDRITAIGYLPSQLPEDAEVDPGYSEIRRTEGSGFSAREPLRYWADLISAGVDPKSVKLLGINGGIITAVEFRIALALGASVGLMPESGREADRLLNDEVWRGTDNLLAVLNDPHTMSVFIRSGVAKASPDLRETIGRAVHDEHRRQQIDALPGWDQLAPWLRESSMLQADHIWFKLKRIGCQAARVTDRKVALMTFTENEVETLAEMEHGRWNVERLSHGWTLGERDPERKRSPYLVPWADLPEYVREMNRQFVRRIPEFLAEVKLEIRRVGP